MVLNDQHAKDISRRKLGLGLGAAALGTVARSRRGRAAEAKTIRIGYLPSLTPFNIGRIRGSVGAALAAHGYEVVWKGPFPAFAPAVEALTPGDLDFTVGSSTSAASAMVAEAPFKIFAYAPPPQDSEGVLARDGTPIMRIADLIGKKVAVNRGGTGEYLLAKALEVNGISPGKVSKLYMGPSDAAYAFSTGNIGAWAVWDPYVAIAQARDKARVIASSQAIGSENATILVVRNGFLDRDPDAVRLVYEACQAENHWTVDHVPEAAALWGGASKIDPAVIDVLAGRHPFVYGPANAQAVASLEHVAQWFYDQKIIPSRPDVRKFVVEF
jgi:sulfonate transport system substrate-binding protein